MTKREQILRYFPHRLTDDQAGAIADICSDLSSGKVMRRLLQGDVGTGKTLCAFFAAMLAAMNNRRTLILVPTTILATQHFDTLKSYGWDKVTLITGGSELSPSLYANIVIGTTAMLNNIELLKSASLVIVDEQQKFGTQQRATLQNYGNPHLLMLTATPIPRTLIQTVFGDLDVSTVKQLPINRGTIVTKWVLPGHRQEMYRIIEGELAKGRQAYFVYPRIKSGDEDIENATDGWRKVGDRFKYYYRTELLTGKSSNKIETLQEFRAGKIHVLVSTIIAEVGLDNSNATVMVVEGADRFGLSQLHQLRGRVSRSTQTAICFLVAETANETSIARLRTLEQTNDGFEIAEADLRLRGPGEMFSTRQHGLPDLKFASLVDDYNLLLKARDEAKILLDKLEQPEYNGLKEMLRIKYPKLTFVGVA